VKETKNETFLAAEFAACGVPPGKSAIAATDLCAMGRRYFRLSERLCGGEEEWGPQPEAQGRIEKAEARRTRLGERIAEKLFDVGAQFTLVHDWGGLGLVVESRAGRTALR
jgi:hypothetical protein